MISIDIIVISLEVTILLHLDLEYKIPSWSSLFTLTALTLHSQILTMTDPFRYLHILSTLLVAYTSPSATPTWGLNRHTLPFAFTTLHLDSHRTLSEVDSASASTASTFGRCCAWFALATWTSLADASFLKLDLFLDTFYRLLESDVHIEDDICSSGVACLLPLAIHIEEGSEVIEDLFIEPSSTSPEPSESPLLPSEGILPHFSIFHSCLIIHLSFAFFT